MVPQAEEEQKFPTVIQRERNQSEQPEQQKIVSEQTSPKRAANTLKSPNPTLNKNLGTEELKENDG